MIKNILIHYIDYACKNVCFRLPTVCNFAASDGDKAILYRDSGGGRLPHGRLIATQNYELWQQPYTKFRNLTLKT